MGLFSCCKLQESLDAYHELSDEKKHLKNDVVSPNAVYVRGWRYKGTPDALSNALGFIGHSDTHWVVSGFLHKKPSQICIS